MQEHTTGSADVSVVIPTLNCEHGLRRLLKSISLSRGAKPEVIVVDGGSRDDTVQVAGQWGAKVDVGKYMSDSRNIGAKLASSEVLIFLDSDMEIPPNLLLDCVKSLSTHDAVCVDERVAGGGYWGQARGLEKRAMFGSTYFEAARAFRRSVFLEVGGYDEALINSVEDIELQFRLIQRGCRLGWIVGPIVHHEEQLGLSAYLRKRSGRSIRPLRDKSPDFWPLFSSPVVRLGIVLKFVRRNGRPRDLALIPGLAIIRGSELVLRA
jgi:glycosyltransferase involved in cell wall biosynthesis